MLESAMEPAYTHGDNTGMTATDTQKNTVYYVAKGLARPTAPERFAELLAEHFIQEYPLVSKAKVTVEQKAWDRAELPAGPHDHGFVKRGDAVRFARVELGRGAAGGATVTSGVRGLTVCKTTQSGYEGYLQDRFTLLPPTRERLLATAMTCSWKYTAPPSCYNAAFRRVKGRLLETFFGPVKGGVYSPSVQYTLFMMGKDCIEQLGMVDSMYFRLPNIHFIPCSPVTSEFEDDVYLATSEPHGDIEATVSRDDVLPHAKL